MQRLMDRLVRCSVRRNDNNPTLAHTGQPAEDGLAASSALDTFAGIPPRVGSAAAGTRRGRAITVPDVETLSYNNQVLQWASAAPPEEHASRQEAARKIRQLTSRRGGTTLDLVNSGLTSLPPLPKGLTALHASGNQLLVLPPLPPTLQYLDAHSNCLIALPTLPQTLETLNVENNFLTALPVLSTSLTCTRESGNLIGMHPTFSTSRHGIEMLLLSYQNPLVGIANNVSLHPYLGRLMQWLQKAPADEMTARRNVVRQIVLGLNELPRQFEIKAKEFGLTSLPELPPGLGFLEVSGNRITELPELPVNLARLHVDENPLNGLPKLPAGLEALSVRETRLSTLRELPDTLEHLDVSYNELSVLPELPAGLTTLFANYNRLTVLPEIPSQLSVLYVRNNELTVLPELPPSLRELTCSQNRLSMISNLPANMRLNTARYRGSPTFFSCDFFCQSLLPETPDFDAHISSRNYRSVILANGPQIWIPAAPELVAAASEIFEVDEPASDMHATSTQATAETNANLLSRAPPDRDLVPTTGEELARQESGWCFPQEFEFARQFNQFACRITEVEDYQNVYTRSSLIKRVNALVKDMRRSCELRDLCFNIAADATQTCGDRIALTLRDMELARIDHHARTGKYSMEELFSLGEGFFKLQILDDLSQKKFRELSSTSSSEEEIGMRMRYQSGLAAALQLPGVARGMLFERCARVADEDLRAAENTVLEKIYNGESVDFLAQWQPWRKALERKFPADYELVNKIIEVNRDAIVNPPPRMTEQRWRKAFDLQSSFEETLLSTTADRLTRAYILERGAQ